MSLHQSKGSEREQGDAHSQTFGGNCACQQGAGRDAEAGLDPTQPALKIYKGKRRIIPQIPKVKGRVKDCCEPDPARRTPKLAVVLSDTLPSKILRSLLNVGSFTRS